MCRSPWKNVTFEFVLTFLSSIQHVLIVLRGCFWDRRWVAVQLLFCEMLLPALKEKDKNLMISGRNYHGCRWRRCENTSAQAKSLLHSLEQVARRIGIYMNSNKTESRCFNQNGAISLLKDKPLKFVNQFIYFRSNISSAESNITQFKCKKTVKSRNHGSI